MGSTIPPLFQSLYGRRRTHPGAGSFVVYTLGQAASPALERVAEDGDTAAITADFTASGAGSAQATIGGGPIAPGATVSFLFDLDPLNAQNRYFSFASMIIPSNDAFIGNGNPTQFQIFDAMGKFNGVSQIVMGTIVRDAGTEVNDEIPMNTAFFGQAAPNVGTAQNGVVGVHPGFIPGGAILSDPMFANANFSPAATRWRASISRPFRNRPAWT